MNKLIAFILALAGFTGTFPSEALTGQTENTNGNAEIIQTNENIETGAWITLANTIEGKNMTFFDGGQEDTSSSSYNEKVVIEGVEARKFYVGNHAYFRMDESFYDKNNDHEFFIDLTCYQFGPERGRITFNYASLTGKKTITVWKEKDPMWVTKRIYINDAKFDHSITDEFDSKIRADIQLVSGVYNAFSRIEITNAKLIKYNDNFDVGTVAEGHADALYKIGLYASSKNDATSDLKNKLTKGSAAEKIVKIMGRQKEAEKYTSQMTGATESENHAIGYLQNKNYINWEGDATAPISQTEITEIFAKAQDFNTQGDIIQNAVDKGLLKTSDMFHQPNKNATEDNLVSLGYNWLLMKNRYGTYNIADMMDKKLIDENLVKNASEKEISCLYYSVPRTPEKKEIIDSRTGRKYYHIDRGTQLVRDYYTANNWCADNKRFVVEDEDGGGNLFLYDTEKNTLRFLCYGGNPIVSKKTDHLYYFDYDKPRKVMQMDLNTFETKYITDLYKEYSSGWGTSLTDDEKYLTVNGEEHENELDSRKPFGGYRGRIVPVLNIETGEWDRSFHREFVADESDGMVLNHIILNPKYDNLIFFAHEGTAEKTPDRIWLLDKNTNEAFNLFRQKQITETLTGEPAGHEMWFGDGERLGFVKYPKSTNLCYSGLMTIDLTGKHKEYVNSDYQYWHSCSSPADDRWMVGDTNESPSKIILVDRYSGESYLLCEPILGKWQHPGHPHPSFSQDGKQVSFMCGNGDDVIATAWMDISDIVDNAPVGGRIQISDVCEVPSYKGTRNYIEEYNVAGADCYKVPVGKSMLVNVKDEKYQGDRVDATITFSYYDAGYTPVKLSYFGWNEKSTYLDKTEQMKYEIPRKNSKQWKSVSIELKDINFDNMEHIGTDLKLEGTYADVCIKDLNVEVTNVISDFLDELPWTKYNKPEGKE